MTSDSTKPLVFISYAHLDEPDPPEEPAQGKIRWLSFVMKFLQPGVKGRRYEVWIDRLMPGGADWNPEIEAKARACDIFVLLVSANSTGSDYIVDKEIPIVRERQQNGDGVWFYPLLLDWTPKAGLQQVNDKNLRPRDAKPFSSLSPSERSRAMSEAADEIAEVAKAVEERKAAVAGQSQPVSSPLQGLGSLLGPAITNFIVGGIERIAPATKEAQATPMVDITGLPETGYERLVGRDAELARLDQAWSDGKTNILSLIAEGGAGKSALVNEWLTRLQADGYRSADCVLGWSFYSQGSKERATAADEFLNWALAKLDLKVETNSASAKGEAIAEALMARRTLIVLDGVEPLQHGPGPQMGQLKDQGLRALLRRFATAPPRADHGLIVLTSRAAVADTKRFKDGASPVVSLEQLSDEAGAELLRDNDVWGIDKELRAASRDFGGHPLALTLLASLLKETQNGDVRRRDHIRGLLADADNPRHDQARRVMESYEKEWLAGQPVLLAILYCVGLFDRPASADCLKALRAKPVIRGVTDGLVGLSDEQWRRVVARLREVRLLSRGDPFDAEALDAHPLVREWFGERLKQTNEAGWRAAHSRLYNHLRRSTHEGRAPTLADLAPLYHAIAHACQAGRHHEALEEVYRKRICRRLPDDTIEFYSYRNLGAVSSDLAVMTWYFDTPYEAPHAALSPLDCRWVFSTAGLFLSAQGRIKESLPAVRASLHLAEEAQDWVNAAIAASNQSETELLVGNIVAAVSSAEKAVVYADQSHGKYQRVVNRAIKAAVLYAAGDREKAEDLFVDAEERQRELTQEYSLLYSLRGHQYCDILVSEGRAAAARDRAVQTIEWVSSRNLVFDVALDNMTLGRAHLALALRSPEGRPAVDSTSANAGTAATKFDKAVEGLSASGKNDHLPGAFIARATFRRAVGEWDRAARDLEEAEEIAEPGPMRLYLCDCALERARLALARREAFAPLNGLVVPSPPPPALPDADEAAVLKEQARKELDIARKLILECSYHRRDEELAELDEVIAGRRFADLPPRV
jgi:tetratricopeptide (TPR) repeat protein